MSAEPEVKVETSVPEVSATTFTTITANTVNTTTTITTTATTINADTITINTTTTTSGMMEQMKDNIENPTSSCIKLDDRKNEQSHSNFIVDSATVSISSVEKQSSTIIEHQADLVQTSSHDTVAENGVIPNSSVNRPENTTLLTSESGDFANNSDGNKADFGTLESVEHNFKVISDQTLDSEVPASSSPAPSENRIISTIVKSSDTAFIPADGEKKENDLKNGGIRQTGSEKDNYSSEEDYKIKEEFASLDDKEASSDETDHFVDAKSSTQIDCASGDDIIEEIKEQSEDIQDEEEYKYDEEEQEAEPDDDEVEGNPAFIPKSGRYYMHDSRNIDEERTPEPSSHSRADGKWKHDRFDERSQRPKTKRELMNRYGYDIRNEGKNTGSGNVNTATPHSNQTRGTSRGGSNYGNRGRHSNRALPYHPQHQPDDRRDHRRPVQNGAGRPANRGGRRGERHFSTNHQRDQHGTRVFKNSPMNIQKGAMNRTDNHRSYNRNEEHLRDNRQNAGGNRGQGDTGSNGGDPSSTHVKSGGGHTGGKRYSTQRLATNYAPNVQQPPLPQPPPPPLQPTPPTTGPIPIPPPDWRPPAYQGPPPPPSNVPPPPPPPIAIPAPVPNFRPSDIVYFDPQPQQLYRNPIPPRTKKRLEIVPPYQAKNSN